MSQHEWIAVFTINLTDKQAAQAYTFDYHGRRVVADKLRGGDVGTNGGVQVGCWRCELPYTEALNKDCIESNFIKDYDEHREQPNAN